MENMPSKDDLVMISSKEDFQEVKAMLNEIRHRIIPNSYPQEEDNKEKKDLFQ